MRIGVPKDIKVAERRVGLTPAGARECVAHGRAVLVEAGAGAEIIIKVKEPQPAEWTRPRPSQVLFAYLHLAPDRAQAEGLPASGAIAFGTVASPQGGLPLVMPNARLPQHGLRLDAPHGRCIACVGSMGVRPGRPAAARRAAPVDRGSWPSRRATHRPSPAPEAPGKAGAGSAARSRARPHRAGRGAPP